MKATKVDITNFRCIKDMSIEFDPMINVLIGENGTGKTAVLDAIASILSPYGVKDMDESDITNGESFFSIKLVCETGDGIIESEYRVSVNDDEGVDNDGEIIPVYDLKELMEWFYEMGHTEGCEQKLEPVIYALKEFLPEFSDFYAVGDPLRLIAVKDGKKLDICKLSGGEISIIEMVGVLAMRMVINYPKHVNALTNMPGNALTGEGVVLIDEIDMHLHPKLQRMMVPKLLEVFPHCQFIISTNSPHVINHVKPESLFILEQTEGGIAVRKTNETYGKSVDMVLKCIMGMETTRPDEVHADLGMLFRAIDEGELDDARDQIVRMMSKICVDPELVKAGVLIQRKKIIGK